MAAPEFGPWEPMELESVVETFAPASFRWWISGGHALDLHLGRTWREHEDTDLGVARRDLGAFRTLLAGWDLHVAAAGQLTRWRGEPLELARDQNNVWCRVSAGGPWVLDVAIGEGSAEHWIYRRDPSVQVPWEMAVLRTAEGIPYLAPELQLLYKSKGLRAKDEVDAAEVIPSLDARRARAALARAGRRPPVAAPPHLSRSSPASTRRVISAAVSPASIVGGVDDVSLVAVEVGDERGVHLLHDVEVLQRVLAAVGGALAGHRRVREQQGVGDRTSERTPRVEGPETQDAVDDDVVPPSGEPIRRARGDVGDQHVLLVRLRSPWLDVPAAIHA